jgi:hypothetical protein
MACPAVADFSAYYARELSSSVWFVVSLGADAHRAADVAQSAFAEAFVVWGRIVPACPRRVGTGW